MVSKAELTKLQKEATEWKRASKIVSEGKSYWGAPKSLRRKIHMLKYGTATGEQVTAAQIRAQQAQAAYREPTPTERILQQSIAPSPAELAFGEKIREAEKPKQSFLIERKELPSAPPTEIRAPTFLERRYTAREIEQVGIMGETAQRVLSPFGIFDYKPTRTSPFEPVAAVSITGVGATAEFRPPTYEEMTPEQQLTAYQISEATTLGFSGFVLGKQLQEKYQEKIDIGEFSLPEAREKYAQEFKFKFEPKTREVQERSKIRTEAYTRHIMSETLPLTFGKGLVFGGISALAPPVALTIAGLGVASTAFKWQETKQQFLKYPMESTLHLGAFTTGAVTGGYATTQLVQKGTGFLRTIGEQKIKTGTIVDPRILSGKLTFPTARAVSKHYKLFVKSPYKLPGEQQLGVWHAAPQTFAARSMTGYGTSELPGLYTAPSLSTYFLKIKPTTYKLFGWNMQSVLGKYPTAVRVYPKGIVKHLGGYKKLPSGYYEWTGKVKPGYAYVPGMKSEIEAIIPPGTLLERMPKKYFVEVHGVRVPIFQYKVVGGVKLTTPKPKGLVTAGELSSYSRGFEYGLISPQTLLGGSLVSKAQKRKHLLPVLIGGKAPLEISRVLGKSSLIYPRKPSPYYKPSAPYKMISPVSYKPYAPSFKPSLYYSTKYKSTTPGEFIITEPLYTSTEDIFRSFRFGRARIGKEPKIKEPKYEKPGFYQPSLAALGLRGTALEKIWKARKVPKGYRTGLILRFDVPTYRIKRRKKKGGK